MTDASFGSIQQPAAAVTPDFEALEIDGSNVDHTGDTVETQVKSFTLPADSLKANGYMIILFQAFYLGTAGAKTVSVELGASEIYRLSNSAGIDGAATCEGRTFARNSQSSQYNSTIAHFSDDEAGSSGGFEFSRVILTSEDMSTELDITIKVTLGNAADTISIRGWGIYVINEN